MFDYKKHYKFSVHKYIMDMIESGILAEEVKQSCILWANDIDEQPVLYVNDEVGVCGMYVVHPDWCVEIDPYTMKEVE